MDKHAAQRILKGNGTGFPPGEWLILKPLIMAEKDPALPTLAEHVQRDPGLVVKVLSDNGLCGWALHACSSLRGVPEAVYAALQHAAHYEFGACAQRKLALGELDRLAKQRGCQPLVIKGAANALLFYEKESLRPSRDIDVVMNPDDMARCFSGCAGVCADRLDFPETIFRMAGYAVEAHPFFIAPARWGHYDDLARNSLPLPSFSTLRHPDVTTAFTVALLHFVHHFGRFAFDLLDMARMLDAKQIDMDRTMDFWKAHGLVDLVLPGLTVLDTIAPAISDEAWLRLFEHLNRRKRREVLLGLRLLSFRHLSKLRSEWFNSRLAPPSFLRRVAVIFFGSKDLTQQRTGFGKGHPLFWFFHLIALPTKRLLFFWK